MIATAMSKPMASASPMSKVNAERANHEEMLAC